MSVPCFTRAEHGGIHVIFPLEGRMKQDCLLVNDSVQYVFEQLQREEIALDELRARFQARATRDYERAIERWNAERARRRSDLEDTGGIAPAAEARPEAPTPEKVSFDLYRTLVMLKDHEICNYPDQALLELLPQGEELRDACGLVPIRSLERTAQFLQASLEPDSDVQTFFSLPGKERLPPSYYQVGAVARRHLSQVHVHFALTDRNGEIEAASVVAGLGRQPASLNLVYAAARHSSPEAFEDAIGRHLAALCGLLSIVAVSPMIRFQVLTGPEADVSLHESFLDVIGEIGFRKSFDLPDEIGPGRGFVTYDRTLF